MKEYEDHLEKENKEYEKQQREINKQQGAVSGTKFGNFNVPKMEIPKFDIPK